MRVTFTATYLYPGLLFPEDVTRSIPTPTYADALDHQPDEEGYFSKDGWYAVRIDRILEKGYTDEDGESGWVHVKTEKVKSAVVGRKVHIDEIPDTPQNRTLRFNIEINTKDGYGVKTRCGNWQFASDFDDVLTDYNVTVLDQS